MFYVVSTHEFFYTIGLGFNSIHPSSTSSLYRSHITDHNFFLWKDKKTESVTRGAHGVRWRLPTGSCDVAWGTAFNAIANASVVVVLIPIRSVNEARKRKSEREEEGERDGKEIKKIHVFFC